MKLGMAAFVPALLLAACAANPVSRPFDPSGLPAAVRVPAGHAVSLVLAGDGDMVYECRFLGPTSGRYEWALARPEAKLLDKAGQQVGRHFGMPATWDYWSGSRVTASELAVAPAGDGALPLQLLKADPATGSRGPLTGTTYIQRVNVRGGGMPPADACGWMTWRQTRSMKYQADYVFYRAV